MTDDDVRVGCELSRDYGVATACVKPYSIHQALKIFAGTDVLACAVIGFPHGNSTTGIKVVEAEAAALAGAKEIDMVVNIGKGEDEKYSYKGATHEHLKLMRAHTADSIQIKAAGGVRTLDELLAVRELGVTRIGATATKAMLNEAIARSFEGSLPNPQTDDAKTIPSGY